METNNSKAGTVMGCIWMGCMSVATLTFAWSVMDDDDKKKIASGIKSIPEKIRTRKADKEQKRRQSCIW